MGSSTLGKLRKLRAECRRADARLIPVMARHALFKLRGKNILASNGVRILGLDKIETGGLLKIGLQRVGFVDRHDRTLLRIEGDIRFAGDFSIGRGCRFDIGENAKVAFQTGFINPNTSLIIMHGLTVGPECSIAWNCQFLDEDFHALTYRDRSIRIDNRIVIGAHVWIGSNVTVLKGAVIPDGCVVACGSVVNSAFAEKNALIAGNPARVVRRDISWS